MSVKYYNGSSWKDLPLDVNDIWWATYDPLGTSSSYQNIKAHITRFKLVCINYDNKIYILNSHGSKMFFESIDADHDCVHILSCNQNNFWSTATIALRYDDSELVRRVTQLENAQAVFEAHMADTTIHTNTEEKTLWTNKVNIADAQAEVENLQIIRDSI